MEIPLTLVNYSHLFLVDTPVTGRAYLQGVSSLSLIHYTELPLSSTGMISESRPEKTTLTAGDKEGTRQVEELVQRTGVDSGRLE